MKEKMKKTNVNTLWAKEEQQTTEKGKEKRKGKAEGHIVGR